MAALEALFKRFTPDLLIYLAGADPHEGDRLGRLKLSMEGCQRQRPKLECLEELVTTHGNPQWIIYDDAACRTGWHQRFTGASSKKAGGNRSGRRRVN